MTLVIPLSDARADISSLTDKPAKLKTVLLTKRGRPKAVLVDVGYWNKVVNQLGVLTKRTYIKKELLPFTRDFSSQEISEWLKEDQL